MTSLYEAMLAEFEAQLDEESASATDQIVNHIKGLSPTQWMGKGVDIDVIKASGERRYTFGVVYKASTETDKSLDAHKEYVSADELEKALWKYVQSGDRNIYLQHGQLKAIGMMPVGEWVEIVHWPYETDAKFILPGQETITRKIPAGSVYMGVIWNEEAWPLVKAGKIRGFSFGGRARKVLED